MVVLLVVLQPAIDYADHGYPIDPSLATAIARSKRNLEKFPSTAKVFLPNGRAPEAGELFHNPDLARSLRAIVAHGGEAFYRGEIAARILECSVNRGGALAPADLSDFRPEWVTPDGDLRTLPCHLAEHDGIDGFYAARLVKLGAS